MIVGHERIVIGLFNSEYSYLGLPLFLNFFIPPVFFWPVISITRRHKAGPDYADQADRKQRCKKQLHSSSFHRNKKRASPLTSEEIKMNAQILLFSFGYSAINGNLWRSVYMNKVVNYSSVVASIIGIIAVVIADIKIARNNYDICYSNFSM